MYSIWRSVITIYSIGLHSSCKSEKVRPRWSLANMLFIVMSWQFHLYYQADACPIARVTEAHYHVRNRARLTSINNVRHYPSRVATTLLIYSEPSVHCVSVTGVMMLHHASICQFIKRGCPYAPDPPLERVSDGSVGGPIISSDWSPAVLALGIPLSVISNDKLIILPHPQPNLFIRPNQTCRKSATTTQRRCVRDVTRHAALLLRFENLRLLQNPVIYWSRCCVKSVFTLQ